MVKRGILATLLVIFGGAAWADHAIRPVEPEPVVAVSTVTREVCTTAEWGIDEVRSDCRMAVVPAAPGNPALSGVCTTYYGRRNCY